MSVPSAQSPRLSFMYLLCRGDVKNKKKYNDLQLTHLAEWNVEKLATRRSFGKVTQYGPGRLKWEKLKTASTIL